MISDRWAQLEPLLNHALELPVDELGPWLEAQRLAQPELIAELEALLAAESGPRAAWADRPSAEMFAPNPGGLVGQVIGNYRIEGPIGRGGMGSVWLASRSDGRYEGMVAVKLLNLALVGRAGEERFHQEGTVLARLTHPNIARLLDAGVSVAGQPYLVLEYVEGEPIDRYAERHHLGVSERIALVLAVIDAVAAAHANLIVHRDLKPSNILVTPDGTVKLLDFGISKMLQEGRPTEATFTEGGAMTPEYAAPELVQGERISTATDVYSLGVLLYQLLSGRHPTSEGLTTIAEHLRAVTEVEPRRLSEAAGDRLRLPRGDLDLILAKALKKAPAERYQTVAEFGTDLKAYLGYRPITARPDSWGYRARRFVRRNRGSLIAAGIVVAALSASTIISLRQLTVARQQRDLARQSMRRTEASVTFESLLFRAMDGDEEKPFTYRELFDRARQLVERQFRHDPEAQLQLLAQFGQHYLRRDELPNATETLTRALVIADSFGHPEWQGRARCNLSLPLSKDGKGDTALVLVRAGERFLLPLENVTRGAYKACDDAEGDAFMALGNADSAGVAFQRTLDRYTADGDTTGEDYVVALNNRARAANLAFDLRATIAALRRMLAMSKAGSTSDPSAHQIILRNLEITYSRAGEYQTDLEFLRSEMREMAGGLDIDTLPDAMLDYYGNAFAQLGMADSARKWLQRSLQKPENIGRTYEVISRAWLANLAREGGDSSAVQAQLDTIARIRAGGGISRFWVSLVELGRAGGTAAEVEAVVVRELDSVSYGKARVQPLVMHLVTAARSLNRAGNFAAAARYADAAVAAGRFDSVASRQNGRLGAALIAQAEARLGLGDTANARTSLKAALPPLRHGFGEQHPLTLAAVSKLTSLPR